MKKRFWIMCCVMLVAVAGAVFAGCSNENSVESLSRQVNSYTIDAELDYQNKTLSATMQVDYHNTSTVDFGELKFHLYPNAFREDATVYRAVSEAQKNKVYPNGFSEGMITVNSVAANGENVDFQIGGEDKNLLIVPLNSTLKSGDWVKLEMNFALVIPNVTIVLVMAQTP